MGQPPTQQVPTKPDPTVLAAIDALSIRDIERLESYARWKMNRLARRVRTYEWKDLLQQAYLKTLYGDRPWCPDDKDKSGRPISIAQHLFGCMRSIAHGWFEKESKASSLPDELGSVDSLQRQVEAHTYLEKLAEGLKGNVDALIVLEAIARGYTPNETQADFHMSYGRYWAARKRIARMGRELFGSSEDVQK